MIYRWKVGLKGRSKLADRWEQESYLVVNQPDSDIPVYKVARETGKGTKKLRTLHRNMLLPFTSIPVEVPPSKENHKVKPKQLATPIRDEPETTSSSTDSDSESVLSPVWLRRSNRRQRNSVPEWNTSIAYDREVIGNPSPAEVLDVTDPDLEQESVLGPAHDTTMEFPHESTQEPVQESETSVGSGDDVDQSVQPRRPTRDQKPPDRYGNWLFSMHAARPESDEVYV